MGAMGHNTIYRDLIYNGQRERGVKTIRYNMGRGSKYHRQGVA
jgi:hypothetical protein